MFLFIPQVCSAGPWPRLLYSKELHHEILPQLITLAGVMMIMIMMIIIMRGFYCQVLGAVPLDTDTELDLSPSWRDKPVAFSAAQTFPEVIMNRKVAYSHNKCKIINNSRISFM